MSVIQCHDCSFWIDPKENPELYRKDCDQWICDECWHIRAVEEEWCEREGLESALEEA